MIRFTTGTARVQVPATSANLGPGFDSFGLALGRYDEVRAEIADHGIAFKIVGEGVDSVPRDEGHLIARAMRATFSRLGAQPSGLRLFCVNRIPHGRGLGSSAAAIVAGVLLARSLVVDGQDRLDEPSALALASELEGHPDNVAACLLGGLTVAWTEAGRAAAQQIMPTGINPAVFIPPGESSTAAARAALPELVPHADAAFNAARASMLILGLTGHRQLLLRATEDRLHQPYRAPSMPDSTALLSRLRTAGLPAVISGAGSSVLALLTETSQYETARGLTPDGWEFAPLPVADGAYVDRPEE